MTEPASPTSRWHSGWGLWLTWVASTCAGTLALGLLELSIVALGAYIPRLALLPVAFLFSGAAEHFVVRSAIAGETRWLRNTFLAGLFAILPALVLFVIFSVPSRDNSVARMLTMAICTISVVLSSSGGGLLKNVEGRARATPTA
jgi:hypothetical protein